MSDAIIVAIITGACAVIAQLIISRSSAKELYAKLDKQSEISDQKLDAKLEKYQAVTDEKIFALCREKDSPKEARSAIRVFSAADSSRSHIFSWNVRAITSSCLSRVSLLKLTA